MGGSLTYRELFVHPRDSERIGHVGVHQIGGDEVTPIEMELVDQQLIGSEFTARFDQLIRYETRSRECGWRGLIHSLNFSHTVNSINCTRDVINWTLHTNISR